MRILLSIFISLICINITANEEFPVAVINFVEAFEEADINTVQKLIDQGFSVNSALMIQALGSHPLHRAVKRGDERLTRIILDAGADADLPSSNTWTPLMTATFNGHINIVRLLLERGADPCTTNYWDKTALFWAEKQILEHKKQLESQEVFKQIASILEGHDRSHSNL